jgi:hypothetical protein
VLTVIYHEIISMFPYSDGVVKKMEEEETKSMPHAPVVLISSCNFEV